MFKILKGGNTIYKRYFSSRKSKKQKQREKQLIKQKMRENSKRIKTKRRIFLKELKKGEFIMKQKEIKKLNRRNYFNSTSYNYNCAFNFSWSKHCYANRRKWNTYTSK